MSFLGGDNYFICAVEYKSIVVSWAFFCWPGPQSMKSPKKKKKLLFCACTLKERNISFAFKQESLRMYAGTSSTWLHNWCVHFSFFHLQQKAHQSCGDVWYSWWEEVSAPLGAESHEVESERGQRAWERIGIIFSARTFFCSPGITGNLWGEVSIWDMIHE